MVRAYSVTVRNRLTGETAVLHIEAGCELSAQVEALTHAFRHLGWRRVQALVPASM